MLLHGQACSALTALTGATSTLLVARGVNAPTAQSAPMYFLLALLWLRGARSKPAAPRTAREAALWFALAVVDVEANCLVVSAYRYTNLTSVMLLDCFTIPCVMALSRAFLRARYDRAHVLGAAICFLGVLATLASDAAPPRWGGPAHGARRGAAAAPSAPILGDALAVGGAALYAVSNVAQEAFVKERGAATLLGRLGAAGAVVSALQAAVFERRAVAAAVAAAAASPAVAGLLAGYVAALAAMYGATSAFLARADAAAFNLSLLTADAYALLFAALVSRRLPPPLYYLALLLTATGVVVYHAQPPPTSANVALGRGRAPSFAATSDTSSPRNPLLRDGPEPPAATPETGPSAGGDFAGAGAKVLP